MKNKLYTSGKLLLQLAQKDFQSRYLGSYLGILWAFIQPLIQILLFWFVFQVGFKSKPVDDFPFILWLICAMVPWFFFSDSIQNATNSILEYSYLVKKMVFRVSILPFVKILSAFFVHLFFICFLFLMFIIYGYYPDMYALQVIYYMICTFLLVFGLSFLTATLNVFLKDTGQMVGVIIQLGFWLTPIFYSLKIVPEYFHFILKLNPMYYIVEGYRNTFIYHQWFWEHPWLTLNFWLISLTLLVIGVAFFKRMRPHFADVL